METAKNNIFWKLSNTTNGLDALDNFYTDHMFVDWYKQRRTKDILSILQKRSFFGLDNYQFWEYRFTQIGCAKIYEFING